MRKWHRWLSLVFGIFALWIAVTGALSQLVPLYLDAAQPKPAAAAEQAKPAFVCPPDYSCRPKPKPGDPRSIVGTLHHLHSGESFGPLGVAGNDLVTGTVVAQRFAKRYVNVQRQRHGLGH